MSESRWYRDLETWADMRYQAKTVLLASGMTPTEIDTVLLASEPNTDTDLTAARAVSSLLRSKLENRDVR